MSVLDVPIWAWAATIAALAVLLGADLFISARRRQPEGLGEAALWTAATIALAVGFGALVALAGSGAAAGQFFAGWLTEYSLSLDNLLVFVLLISSSGVARQYHGRVLLLGILLALVLRGVLIALGGAALHQFAWVEYLFGALLIYAAARIAFRGAGPAAGTGTSAPMRVARRIVPVAPGGDGARLTTRVRGRRHATPLLILVIAIGVTDVLFAVDSIPAIFGLTRDPFLVFSANLFALLGLRHLYFLISGLLNRLVYLPAGLAVILGFIGLKLIGEALLAYGVDHLGPVPVPHVSAGVSLAVIAGVLLVTTVTSLAASRRRESRECAAGRAGQAAATSQAGRAGQAGARRADEARAARAGQAGTGRAGQAGTGRAGQAGTGRAGRAGTGRPGGRTGHAGIGQTGTQRPGDPGQAGTGRADTQRPGNPGQAGTGQADTGQPGHPDRSGRTEGPGHNDWPGPDHTKRPGTERPGHTARPGRTERPDTGRPPHSGQAPERWAAAARGRALPWADGCRLPAGPLPVRGPRERRARAEGRPQRQP